MKIATRNNKIKQGNNILSHIFLTLLSIVCIFPLVSLIIITYTPEKELMEFGVRLIPNAFSWEAYKIVFEYPKSLFMAYGVTIFVTVVGTILDVIISSMAAYSLSRSGYKFKNATSFYLYFTVLFNGGLIPTYWMISQVLQLKNTIWVLIFPILASPWNIFLLRTFFNDTPEALFEAAKIDGANEFQVFGKILLPIVKPAIGTIALMIALTYWNDWYNAMLYIDKPELTTLQLMLQRMTDYVNSIKQFRSMAGGMVSNVELPSTGIMSVTCLVAAGPMLVVFLAFQKYFVSGLTVGAVKE